MSSVPVLYYHSIADHAKDSDDPWRFLSIDIAIFKSQIAYLKRKGYYACDWSELADHINGVKQLPVKTVLFHFDDGFLDNWTIVFPIMKEAGFKYCILITPEFIEKGDTIRPFVEKTVSSNKEHWWGYLNEEEIRKMSASNLVEFQSHGYTHTWYACSDTLIDIVDEENFYPHILWNLHEGSKPNWLLTREALEIPRGYPVFEFKKSIALNSAFIPNKDFITKAINVYDPTKSKLENLEVIKNIRDNFQSEHKLGAFENEDESHSRLKKELLGSKKYIEDLTDRSCDFIVFPGGGHSDRVDLLCKDFGYKMISKGSSLNTFNSKNYRLFRQSGVYNFPVLNRFLNLLFLRLQLKRGQGNGFIGLIFKYLRQ